MGDLIDYAPIAATAVRDPPVRAQILKLRATDDVGGVSWSWATVTSINNGAWIAYFAFSGYWTALVPSSSATVLAGTLATMLALRGQAQMWPAVLIGAWAAFLAGGFAVAGRTGLGTLLTRVCPPGDAVDLDGVPNRSPHGNLTRNLDAHLR
jgi:hypothetical protein